jgi:hypothetical protein
MGAKKKLEADRLFPATPLVDARRALISKHLMGIAKKLMMAADISDVSVARVIRDEGVGALFDLEREFNERIKAQQTEHVSRSMIVAKPTKSQTRLRVPKASRVPTLARKAS